MKMHPRKLIAVILAALLALSFMAVAEGEGDIGLIYAADAAEQPREIGDFSLAVPEAGEEAQAPNVIADIIELGVKEKYTLNTKGMGKKLTFKSSKAKVATVSKKGVVTAKKKGAATITVYSNKKEVARFDVRVLPAPKSVSFESKSITIGLKESVQLEPIVNDGAKASFTWASKDKKIASVSKKGVVKGKKKGKTKITVKAQNGKSATLTVKVLAAPKSVSLNKESATLEVGKSASLKAKLPKTTASRIKWTSNTPKVATVDESGVVTAVAPGTAKITAKTFNGKTATCVVTVSNPATEPTATPTAEPTATPTAEPTATPIAEPTETPTSEPTTTPAPEQSAEPSVEPIDTTEPSVEPSAEPSTEPTEAPVVGKIESVTVAFDDVAAGEDVVVLSDAAVTVSWTIEGDAEKVDLYIDKADGELLASEQDILMGNYTINPSELTEDEVYTLRLAVTPVNGGEADIVWKKVSFKREKAAVVESAAVLMNIPYDVFYASEGAENAGVDAVSSATKNKPRTIGLAGGSYHVNSDGSDITGVIYPVYVQDVADLEALGGKAITDEDSVEITVTNRGQTTTSTYTGKEALFEAPSYSYYVLDVTPSVYKTLTGVEGGAPILTAINASDTAVSGEAGVSYADSHCDVAISVTGFEPEGNVSAVELITSDGGIYGLRHVVGIWRKTSLGFNRADAVGEALVGKTITGIRYITTAGKQLISTELTIEEATEESE